MFTGIIEGLGAVTAKRPAGSGKRMEVEAGFELTGTRIGDSIAVNGACLTVVHLAGRRFAVDVSPETLSSTTLGEASVGQRVNVERAMRLGDRLDGHLVSGHVDGTATVTGRTAAGNAVVFSFSAAPSLTRYMIAKGSVAVDGVSLTINRLVSEGFDVSIIPHTARSTVISDYVIGRRVNIETDIIGKYIEKFVVPADGPPADNHRSSPIDMAFLNKTGFV